MFEQSAFEILVDKASRVTQRDKDEWQAASSEAISAGDYQALTEKGYQQAVDNLAYYFARAHFLRDTGQLTIEEERAQFVENRLTVAELLMTIAVASKTHMDLVALQVAIRVREYIAEMRETQT